MTKYGTLMYLAPYFLDERNFCFGMCRAGKGTQMVFSAEARRRQLVWDSCGTAGSQALPWLTAPCATSSGGEGRWEMSTGLRGTEWPRRRAPREPCLLITSLLHKGSAVEIWGWVGGDLQKPRSSATRSAHLYSWSSLKWKGKEVWQRSMTNKIHLLTVIHLFWIWRDPCLYCQQHARLLWLDISDITDSYLCH